MSDEEDATAQLLRLAGAAPDPLRERGARVREAVHRAWRANRRRRRIRHSAAVALLGAAASVIVAVWMTRPRPAVAPGIRVVAVGQRIQGQPLIARGPLRAAPLLPLSVSTSIHADDVIETDEESRAAVQAGDGTSVRIDRGSRVRFVASDIIEVLSGAVYVATSDRSHGFEVRTAMGALRDVGTQFEVRLTGLALRVRVRTGKVEIRRASGVAAAAAGTEAMVMTSSIAVRQVRSYGPEWLWMTDVAPSFAIDGRPLDVFLQHTAVEEGWTLRYADAAVADAARRTILHGSIDGLKAEDALAVALATSGLQYRVRGGELFVSRPANAR